MYRNLLPIKNAELSIHSFVERLSHKRQAFFILRSRYVRNLTDQNLHRIRRKYYSAGHELMSDIPAGARLADSYPESLENEPGCRSISDDDLCAFCHHLAYRPGETSLCQLMSEDNDWPACFDADGYAQSCTQLQLIFTAPQPAHG